MKSIILAFYYVQIDTKKVTIQEKLSRNIACPSFDFSSVPSYKFNESFNSQDTDTIRDWSDYLFDKCDQQLIWISDKFMRYSKLDGRIKDFHK